MRSKVLAMLMSATMLIGVLPLDVLAQDYKERQMEVTIDEGLTNGKYIIKNDVFKVDKDEESMARKYLNEESMLEIKEKDIKLTLNFIGKSIMKNIIIKVDDKPVEYTMKEKENDKLIVTLPIKSVESNIIISAKIFGTMPVDFRVKLNKNTLEKDPNENEEDNIKDGIYEIQNDALHIDKDEESMARKYLDKNSHLKVENGQKMLILKFTGKSMMSNHKVQVNGEDIDLKIIEDKGDMLKVGFNISSLKDSVVVSTKILGSMNVQFRLVLKEETLKKVENNKPDTDNDNNTGEIPNPPTDGNESGDKPNTNPETTPDKNPNEHNQYKNGTYKIKNKIISDSEIGHDAARDSINEISYIEVKNGKTYITLGFSQTNLMSNIKILVNGKEVKYDVIRKDEKNNTMDIKFEVPSLSSKITVQSFINMIERNISFGVQLLENTLEVISQEQVDKPLGNSNSLGALSKLSGESDREKKNNNKSENSNSNKSIEVKEYFKKYTINNEVISDSSMGRKMARKYLDEISILEEVDGKFYLTIKFSGTNAMDNFKIKVNGELVDYELVLDDEENNIKAFRFPINNISDEIKVYIFIKPVKLNIDFGISLKEDTMTLIEEGTAGSKENKIDNTVLLQSLLNNSNNKPVSVLKIAMITSLFTTISLGMLSGIIYLIIRRKRRAK
ncbi:NEAT domain-containing protein [Clostridium tarantellae]|uniref:NEAT domain-containing protein n=1 Tax=Clostridium tarantellae TaxID=39493 RepID=A0A6I1ML96_9CLOT|nr:NEAT domain-containing protein [Clostridium tarantellae]MPQ43513.1 hypothetical protein [Clostridium tarantellae]